jgi:hypothetical protein
MSLGKEREVCDLIRKYTEAQFGTRNVPELVALVRALFPQESPRGELQRVVDELNRISCESGEDRALVILDDLCWLIPAGNFNDDNDMLPYIHTNKLIKVLSGIKAPKPETRDTLIAKLRDRLANGRSVTADDLRNVAEKLDHVEDQ